MGYYTNYQVNIEGEMVERLSEISGYSFSGDGLIYEVKWYDWKKDMYQLSCEFPDYLFIVEGEGEEQGDLWKAYFKDGAMQFCKVKMTFDKFSPEKLVKLFE